MTRRHYPRPPILEAIIDIQVGFETSIDLERLAQLGASEAARYPQRQPLMSFSMVVDAQAGAAVDTKQSHVGFRYWTAAQDAVVQLRTNGLLFSKLRPYGEWEWEKSLAEMQRLWGQYCTFLTPSRVTRLAVRYINKIDLPASAANLNDYFNARPELPTSMPLAVDSFLMRLEIPLGGIEGGVLLLTQGTTDSGEPDRYSVLLDLDLSRRVDATCHGEPMWQMLQELHDRENQLFESCITEATRELFQ